jgi:hypothetical protein
MMSDRKLTTKTFTDEQLDELLDDAETIATEPWRHGTHQTMVFEHEGAHWRVGVRYHHEEGRERISGGYTATKVAKVPKTIEVWEPCE